MKKVVIFIMLLLLVLMTAACNPLNLMEQISQQTDEYKPEDAGVTNGPTMFPVNAEDFAAWPSDQLPDTVPVISGTTVSDVIAEGGNVLVSFEGGNQVMIDAYVAELKDLGWELWSESLEEGCYYAELSLCEDSLSLIWDQCGKIGTLLWIGGLDDSERALEWPGNRLPDTVPQIPDISVLSISGIGGDIMISFSGCSQVIADAYIAELESLGWELGYGGQNEGDYFGVFSLSDETLNFAWNQNDGTGDLCWQYSDTGTDGYMAWPDEWLPDTVPEISGVSVTMVVEDSNGVIVLFEGCSQETVDDYEARLLSLGWDTGDKYTHENMWFADFTLSGATLELTWAMDDGTGSLFYPN